MRMRLGAVVLAAALGAACDRAGGAAAKAEKAPAEARRDSARDEQKALRDSGVTVDTQVIDTGGTKATPAADN